MWYVYVLQSRKNQRWFYKGSTSDLVRRFKEHNKGEVDSTRTHRPLALVYCEIYVDKKVAKEREVSIRKKLSEWKPVMMRILRSLGDL